MAGRIAAYDAGDAGAIAELFTDDCVLIPPEQPAQAGKAGVKSYYGAQFAAFNIVLSMNSVQVEGRYLNIVKREAHGGWKIHRHIWNTPAPMVIPTDRGGTQAANW